MLGLSRELSIDGQFDMKQVMESQDLGIEFRDFWLRDE